MQKIISTLVITLICAIFFFRFERKKPRAGEIVLIAVMSALAIVSRMAFAMFGGFKPSTALIMLAGMAFGQETGFLVGAVVALVSNFYFGQGPWTPWQMLAMGMAGFIAGILYKKGIMSEDKILLSTILGGLIVFLFVGPLLDTSAFVLSYGLLGEKTAAAVYLSGIPMNAIHGVATALSLLVLERPILEMLNRIKIKYGFTS